MNDETKIGPGFSRREVTTMGVWSVPVILAAMSAPLAAATGEIAIEALSPPELDGVEVGDQVPLVFSITRGGSPVSGGASAILIEASGIAAWLDEEGEPSDVDIALVLVEDGYLVVPAVVLGYGSFAVNISFDSSQSQFILEFSE